MFTLLKQTISQEARSGFLTTFKMDNLLIRTLFLFSNLQNACFLTYFGIGR